MDHSRAGNNQGGTAVRDPASTLPGHGCRQHCLCGHPFATVVSSARSSMLSHLGLLLATYPYAALVSLANLAAMILILRKGARLWLKTEKTGYVDKQLQFGTSQS